MKTRLFITSAVFVAMAAIASAQTAPQTQNQTGRGRAAGNVWVDANKDGVCDTYENGARMGRRAYSAGNNQAAVNRGQGRGMRQGMYAAQGRGQGRGQGMYAAQGRGQGRGQGMYAAQGRGQGRGQGVAAGRGPARGNGMGRFNGRGPAFVDANNDGTCDNLQMATPPQVATQPTKAKK